VSADDQYRALRHGAGARLVARDVVEVRGPDAVSYLQGQCSQDVETLAVGAAADALLLSPQGKLDALVRVQRVGDAHFLLDVDGGWGPAVRARLERFKLRVKAEVEELSLQCLAVRGPGADAVSVAGARRVPFSWGSVVGVDFFAPRLEVPDGMVLCDAPAWEALRVEAGIPAMGRELDERTIAAEADLLERCVSFTKGCYTGQELVARIDSRGSNVARRLVGVVAPGDSPVTGGGGLEAALARGMTLHGGPPPPGDGAADDKVVGTITSAAWSAELGSWVALGYLHRSAEAPGPIRVRTGDGLGGSWPARAELLPLSEVAGHR
jgi:tRNA-modifying protein YgfZ